MTSTQPFQTFGELLRFLRKRAGLTLRELGQRVGYSETHVARLEGNKRVPDPMVIQARFFKALELSAQSEYATQLLELAVGSNNAPAHQSTPETPLTSPPLPRPLTTFVGRSEELASLTQLLMAKDGPRLITLVGSGGVGKTRLAIELAQQLTGSAGGVCFVELAPISDETRVEELIAHALNLPERPDMTLREIILNFLGHKEILLVMDNCEHVINRCAAVVQQILEHCHGMRILATSREPLRIAGEMIRRVPSLKVPDSDGSLADNEAVMLFENRAQFVDPTFQIASYPPHLVAQLCRSLDGIPLALEMAAAQLAGMTLDEVVRALGHRFEMLVFGSRTALPRQQTLLATLDWSYNLLTVAEQLVFTRLSVFQGGWTMEAARFVCSDPDEGSGIGVTQVQSALLNLIHKSLVDAQRTRHGTRYRFLETIRDYARGLVSQMAGFGDVQERHLAYYTSLVEQIDWTNNYGTSLERALDLIEIDHENVRAAYAFGFNQPNLGLYQTRLVLGMTPFYMHRGGETEMRKWFGALDYNDGSYTPEFRAKVIYTLDGVNLLPIHEVDALREMCLHICRRSGDIFGVMLLENNLAWAAIKMGHHESLLRHAEEALIAARQLGNPYWIGAMLINQARHLNVLGNPERAATLSVEAYEQGVVAFQWGIIFHALTHLTQLNIQLALRICKGEVERQRDNLFGLAASLQILGRIYLELGIYDQAEATALECLVLWQKLNVRTTLAGGVARALQDAGMAAWFRGQLITAQARLEQSLQIYSELGNLEGVATTQVFLGYLLLDEGKLNQAEHIFRLAINELEHSPDSLFLVMCVAGLAASARMMGEMRRAASLFGIVRALGQRIDASISMAYWQISYNRVMQVLEDLLQDPLLSSALQEGEKLTLEQAITLAKEL